MGLFGWFDILPAPCVMMELLGDDRLPALVHMHMPHCLLTRLVQLSERLERCSAVALRL
jgi:hypothetical protein